MKKPMKPIPPFKTIITPVHNERYTCINDVPEALRQSLKRAYDSGLKIEHISIIYELPEEWITLFVKPQ